MCSQHMTQVNIRYIWRNKKNTALNWREKRHPVSTISQNYTNEVIIHLALYRGICKEKSREGALGKL